MGNLLQGAFPLGFALASVAYGLLFDAIGWRGLLWLGILPALLCVYIRLYVKEPDVWLQNRKRQRELNAEVRAPLVAILKPPLLGNTLTACWWMAGNLVVYYSIYALFATWLQTEFNLAPALVATPVMLSNLVGAVPFWGWLADRIGRRKSMMIAALVAALVAPAYLLTNDLSWIILGVIVQGFFGGALPATAPSYLTERFPTAVRSTAAGFCYHVGAVVGGFVAPVASYFAVEHHLGFAMPMLIGTLVGCLSVILALQISPETKGKLFVAD